MQVIARTTTPRSCTRGTTCHQRDVGPATSPRRCAPGRPDDPADCRGARLQDAIAVEQTQSAVSSSDWDPVSQKTVRDALVTLATTLPDTKDTFGSKADTDPVRHLIGSANAWGGNPQKDALYLTVVPQKNDGSAVHRLTVGEVPVDGFWSVTVYNEDGYLAKNPQDAYAFNNVTAHKDPDGSTTIQFGGCDVRRQLPTDHAGMELHRPAVSAAAGDSRRIVGLSGGATGLGHQHDRADGLAALQVAVGPARRRQSGSAR